MKELAELEVMGQVFSSLSGLPDDESRARVLRWVHDKLSIKSLPSPSNPTPVGTAAAENGAAAGFDSFPDMYHAFDPKSEKDKALIGAYWLRESGTAQFASMEVNRMLKDLGHGIANVTDALSSAMSEKPALIMQIKKSGTSRQARKQYKLTESGVRFVVARLQEDRA